MSARRAGPCAAEALIGERRGVAVSVHARAVNLLLDDGPLVALLPAGSPLHPWALAVPLAARDLARVAERAALRVSDGVLEVGPLRMDLAGLEVVDLRLRRRLRGDPGAGLAALGRSAAAPAAGPFEPALAAALAGFRAGGDAGGLAALVGVGEGLTPSGDDVLVGVLAGLDAAGETSGAATGLRERLCAALERGTSRTTRLSAQMLDAAAAGLYAEPVLALLQTLALPKPGARALERAVAALLAVGHRSGGDTLRGIVAALERACAAPSLSAGSASPARDRRAPGSRRPARGR
jgi:hypothetical protein